MKTIKNTVHLIGRLGQDPEIHFFDKGNKVARFPLATGEPQAGKETNCKRAIQWHNLVVWGNLASICEKYLKKGREIAVEGKLSYRNWEDRNGARHYTTEIIVNELSFMGSKHEFNAVVATASSK
jgi:single-strand DNA-binding protein